MVRGPSALFALLFLGGSLYSQSPPAEHKPDPKSVQRYDTGYRYSQAGWVVLHIEGDPYPRGYQHGRLMSAEIAKHIRFLAAESSPKAPASGWRHIRTMANAMFLRKFDREYLEEMKGIADGAADGGASFDGRKIDLIDIVALNVWLEIDCLDPALRVTPTLIDGLTFPKPMGPLPGKVAPDGPPPVKQDHCSAFIATGPATADGKIVFGHITMFGLMSAPFVNVWLDVKPTNGQRVVMQAFPGGIWSSQDYYMNDAGILFAETTINQSPFDLDGVPLTNRARKAIQYSKSIDDMVKHLSEKNNGLYTNEWLLGDTKTNEIAMFELGTKKTRLYRSGKDDWFGGTTGFYWGCNNAKDIEVRMEAHPKDGRNRKPDFRPTSRDSAWLREFKAVDNKIDAEWGKKVFASPALALPHSLDAKVSTSAMADKLATHAMYGSPTGRIWKPSAYEKELYPEIETLEPHPWTILTIDPPPME